MWVIGLLMCLTESNAIALYLPQYAAGVHQPLTSMTAMLSSTKYYVTIVELLEEINELTYSKIHSRSDIIRVI
jgi:hypothetical protein